MDAKSDMRQWWTVPGEEGGVLEQRTVPIPEPGAHEVLVRVASAGVNRGELIARSAQRLTNPAARPRPSGIECAGEIVDLGEAVEDASIGDRVMARGSACHADYSVLDEVALMPLPASMSFAEAGTIPNVFVTAHDAIVTNAELCAGQTVLISAGSSGIGTAAIQIAAHLDASTVVATTRRSEKAERLRELGADVVIDTSADEWESAFREHCPDGVDVVIDQVGGDLFPSLVRCIAVAGGYVSVGRTAGADARVDLDLLARHRLTLIGVTFRSRSPAQTLACTLDFASDLLPAFSTGKLRGVLDRSFPLAELPAAHEYMLTNQQVGKVILEV